MDDGDDEIVKEISVSLSKSMAENLYVLQYPMKSKESAKTELHQDIIAAKIKPKQQKVEFDHRLDVRSYNYDRGKGEQIALNIDGPRSTESYFSSSRMDKHTYTSTKTVSCKSNYAVGIVGNGVLHIAPLSAILQMHTKFEYCDKMDSQYKSEKKEDDPPEEPEVVTVKIAGPSTEKARKAREKSYKYLQQKLENEPWIPASFNSQNSHRSQDILKELCEVQNCSFTAKFSEDEYLKSLLPERLAKSRIYSESSQNQSPLCNIMVKAKVLPFKQIAELLSNESHSSLQKSLQQIAYLVQGCWVIKSEVLYKDCNSEITGLSGEILSKARDFIMWNYTKSRCLKRSFLKEALSIPIEDITEIVSHVAKKICNKGWEFKYPFDSEFVESQPTIVQRQEMLWEARRVKLYQELRLDTCPKRSFPSPPIPRERRHFKYRESISDDTEESGAESTSSDKMDVSMKSLKASKRSFTRKRNLSSPSKHPNKSMQSYISPTDISPNFLVNLPSIEIKSELLNHVREVIYDKYCITLPELKDTLSEAGLDYIAKREDCNEVLDETLLRAGARKLKNKWPQNTQPVPLYAFTNFQTSFDRYRDTLLNLFTNTARSRPNFLMKKIEDDYGEIVSENTCRQIFEEYCTYKASYYYLKGTVSLDQ